MIFVYPAIVSSSVDPKIGVAVSRVLEQYFLLQLQEAIQNNIIRIGSVWDGNAYGPFVLLHPKGRFEGKTLIGDVLTEAGIPTVDSSNVRQQIENLGSDLVSLKNEVESKTRGIKPTDIQHLTNRSDLQKAKKDFDSIKSELTILRGSATSLNEQLKELVHYLYSNKGDFTPEELKASDAQIKQNRLILDDLLDPHRGSIILAINLCLDAIKEINEKLSGGKDSGGKPWEKEKYEREKKERESMGYETHGMYKVEPMKGVSLKPTLANMSVKIHYIGGPHVGYKSVGVATSAAGSFQEITIGTKVLPARLSNFASLEDAILDDYFSNKFQSLWKVYSRAFIRNAITKIQRWLGDLFDVRGSIEDPIKSNILLSPQGYIDSTSFERKAGTAPFYKYSSAIVIFNKNDIMKEEGANFFANREQLNEMFKMGWNSFCVLDPVKEEAIFVSSLDGGYMHVIPYSYIFNSLGMDQIYKDINDLQKRSPVFRTSKGTFGTFLSRMKKESKLLEASKLLSS